MTSFYCSFSFINIYLSHIRVQCIYYQSIGIHMYLRRRSTNLHNYGEIFGLKFWKLIVPPRYKCHNDFILQQLYWNAYTMMNELILLRSCLEKSYPKSSAISFLFCAIFCLHLPIVLTFVFVDFFFYNFSGSILSKLVSHVWTN